MSNDTKDILDAISINTEQISSLNAVIYDLSEDIRDKELSNKFYALSHSIDLLIKDIDSKTDTAFKLVSNNKE